MSRQYGKMEVRSALEKLGFEERTRRGAHHRYIYRDSSGERRAGVSVPKGRGDLPKSTIAGIRQQMHLDRSQFDEAIRCPFGFDDYRKLVADLVEQGEL